MTFSNFNVRGGRRVVLGIGCLATLMVGLMGPTLVGRAGAPQAAATKTSAGRPLRLLFLGHEQRNHNSHTMFPLLAVPLARRGIQMTHVNTPAEALIPEKLAHYDALVIYGNHETITPEQDKALADFVEGGKALVALHSASFMFRESPTYIPMVGGQFLRHGTGEFTAEIVQPSHPAMQGVTPFTTWDETYVHNAAQPGGPHGAHGARRRDGPRAVDVGAHAGQGPRVLHRLRPRRAHVGQSRLPETGAKPASSGRCPTRRAAAFQALAMPEVKYVDGLQRAQLRAAQPGAEVPVAVCAGRCRAKFIQTPAEFDVQLFASEPDIVKPIAFTFDERGRLWVIEAVDYPNEVLGGAPGDDRIKILEDTNGDGRADKFTVFADSLNLPTSLVFANGGVIVSSAPNFLFLKDTNGDDKADVRQVLSTRLGHRATRTRAVEPDVRPRQLDLGHGRLLGLQRHDERHSGCSSAQGMYRFKPDGIGVRLHRRLDEQHVGPRLLGDLRRVRLDGQQRSELPRGDPEPVLPGHRRRAERHGRRPRRRARAIRALAQFYALHPSTPYIRQVDVFGGYTAGAGHQLYTARAFPKEYWNRDRVHHRADGAPRRAGRDREAADPGFVTRDGWNLSPAPRSGSPRCTRRSGRTARCGSPTGTTSSSSTTPRRPATATARATPTRRRCAITCAAASTASATRTRRPQPRRSLSIADAAGLVAALSADNMFWRLHGAAPARRARPEGRRAAARSRSCAIARSTRSA